MDEKNFDVIIYIRTPIDDFIDVSKIMKKILDIDYKWNSKWIKIQVYKKQRNYEVLINNINWESEEVMRCMDEYDAVQYALWYIVQMQGDREKPLFE